MPETVAYKIVSKIVKDIEDERIKPEKKLQKCERGIVSRKPIIHTKDC